MLTSPAAVTGTIPNRSYNNDRSSAIDSDVFGK